MPFDMTRRQNQALDPSGLTTIGATLDAIHAATDDCRRLGVRSSTDPAVGLLARHLGTVAMPGYPADDILLGLCREAIADGAAQPLLPQLMRRSLGI